MTPDTNQPQAADSNALNREVEEALANQDREVHAEQVVAVGDAANDDGSYTCAGCGEPVAASEAVKTTDGVYHAEHAPNSRATKCPNCGHRFQT